MIIVNNVTNIFSNKKNSQHLMNLANCVTYLIASNIREMGVCLHEEGNKVSNTRLSAYAFQVMGGEMAVGLPKTSANFTSCFDQNHMIMGLS